MQPRQLQYEKCQLNREGEIFIIIVSLFKYHPVSKQDQKFIWSDQNFSR